jgi:hypothetical protein
MTPEGADPPTPYNLAEVFSSVSGSTGQASYSLSDPLPPELGRETAVNRF